MSKPILTPTAGGYEQAWGAEQVSCSVSRIRQDTRQNVTAEVEWRTGAPGLAPHLHQARLNLISTASRRGLAKLLEERLPGLDWYALVEQTCVMVLGEHRQGEPVIKIGSLPPREAMRFRLEPVLLERQPNLIFGPGGIGKSYLATYFSVLVDAAYPTDALTPEPGLVLWLDYEADEHELRERVDLLQRGLDLEAPSGILYRFCSQPLADDVEELKRIVMAHNVAMVVVDSVGLACGGEPESADVTLRYFRALRSLRCTTLSIDHVTKNAETKTAFGSVYKMNSARQAWEMRKAQEPGEDELRIGLFHRKANTSKLHQPLGFRFRFSPDAVTVLPQSVAADADLAKGLSLRENIRALLSGGAMTVVQVAEALEKDEATVRTILNRYKNLFVRLSPTGTARESLWGNLMPEEPA